MGLMTAGDALLSVDGDPAFGFDDDGSYFRVPGLIGLVRHCT